jgi:hypothetical protein
MFIVFGAVVGLASGLIYAYVPASRSFGIPPYFWVLIALALFEVTAFSRGQKPVAPLTRLASFVVALALAFLIPFAAGVEMRLL